MFLDCETGARRRINTMRWRFGWTTSPYAAIVGTLARLRAIPRVDAVSVIPIEAATKACGSKASLCIVKQLII